MNRRWSFKGTPVVIDTAMINGLVADSHEDRNGKWGGYEAWIVHVDSIPSGLMLLYTLVGNYWDVGLAPDNGGPSKWEVVQTLTHALRDGVSPTLLLKKIKEATEGVCAVCGVPTVNTYSEPALCAYHDTPPAGLGS